MSAFVNFKHAVCAPFKRGGGLPQPPSFSAPPPTPFSNTDFQFKIESRASNPSHVESHSCKRHQQKRDAGKGARWLRESRICENAQECGFNLNVMMSGCGIANLTCSFYMWSICRHPSKQAAVLIRLSFACFGRGRRVLHSVKFYFLKLLLCIPLILVAGQQPSTLTSRPSP